MFKLKFKFWILLEFDRENLRIVLTKIEYKIVFVIVNWIFFPKTSFSDIKIVGRKIETEKIWFVQHNEWSKKVMPTATLYIWTVRLTLSHIFCFQQNKNLNEFYCFEMIFEQKYWKHMNCSCWIQNCNELETICKMIRCRKSILS